MPHSRTSCNDRECSYLSYVQGNFPISYNDIKSKRVKDPVLNIYYNRKYNLHVDVLYSVGFRIVVPKSLRELFFYKIYDGHIGIVKMKQIARNYVR